SEQTIRPALEKRVEILTAPPPFVHGRTTFFQFAPQNDPAAIQNVRRHLAEYWQNYVQDPDFPYPFRHRLAYHTGMPSFLRGYRDSSGPVQNPEQARK